MIHCGVVVTNNVKRVEDRKSGVCSSDLLLSATKPACVESITHEMILNKLGALLLS